MKRDIALCVPNSDTRRESYNRLYTRPRLHETHHCSAQGRALHEFRMTGRRDNTTFIRERETRLRGYAIRRSPGNANCILRVSTRLRMFYEIHDGGPLEGQGGCNGIVE